MSVFPDNEVPLTAVERDFDGPTQWKLTLPENVTASLETTPELIGTWTRRLRMRNTRVR